MKIFFLIFLLFGGTLPVYADFVAGIGAEGTGKGESKDKELAFDALYGVRGDFEFGFKYLTFNLSAAYSFGSAESQYNYLSTPVENLETTMGLLRFGAGARLMLLRATRFRLFVGGGGLYGGLSLMYDKDNFLANTGTSANFEEQESQAVRGSYLEAGMDYFLANKYGVRLLYQKSFLRSDAFETLNNKELSFETNNYSLNYIQYVDTKW